MMMMMMIMNKSHTHRSCLRNSMNTVGCRIIQRTRKSTKMGDKVGSRLAVVALGTSVLAAYAYHSCKRKKRSGKGNTVCNREGRRNAAVDRSTIVVVAATQAHSTSIWTWRNDPDTRKNSRSMDIVPWENHVKWYANFLKRKPNCMFVCKDNENNYLCMVRFDKLGEDSSEFEISVNLNPKFRGKKLSTFLIDLSIAHFNKLWGEEVQGIVAEIKPSNIGSRKCFTRAGFKLLKESGNEIDSNKEQCQKYYRKL